MGGGEIGKLENEFVARYDPPSSISERRPILSNKHRYRARKYVTNVMPAADACYVKPGRT